MSEQRSKSILKRLVSQAGAEWVGVQETVPPIPHLLLFNSPVTGSTLAIRLEPDKTPREIVEAIRTRMIDSDKTFKRRTK